MFPPQPSPAIGEFVIGESGIDVPPAFDYTQTIISQYANSPILNQLIADFDAEIDPSANIDSFYDLLWNVMTAQGYGLDVWGRIVGVGRVLTVATGPTYLGLQGPSGPSGDAFDAAPWYAGEPVTGNYALSDSGFRTLILAKALANICDGSIQAINQILLLLFPGRGNCYVTDNGNMQMTYTFNFMLTPVEYSIVANSGVLPRPVAVEATIVQV